MKSIIFLFISLLLASSLFGKQTQVGYVQQDTPGSLVIITPTEELRDVAVVVRDFRFGGDELSEKMEREEFDTIWKSLMSNASVPFRGNPANMSDVGYYTIALRTDGASITLRIPSDEIPESLNSAIQSIHAYIKTKKGDSGPRD